ncbi:WhiB family transcriptional regulator [Dactylosporangium sp. CA-052675]|uniref:WhiB family transcriptional regulator n=1 Tax=Dactylosporangium sp. CA-052675 TaxID=3239927 RepID=UPI003D919CA6
MRAARGRTPHRRGGRVNTIASTGPPRVESWPPRACEGRDTDLWFPVHGARDAQLQRERAKRVCRGCAARLHCAAYALPIGDLAGIWAAMTPGDRERERERQRQKKEA